MSDYPVSELRLVKLWFKDDHIPSTHFMHKDQVDTFVQASLQLHYIVGNPHRNVVDSAPCTPGNGVSLLWRISVQEIRREPESFWWSHISLHEGQGPAALLGDPLGWTNVWKHPALVESDRQAEELE